MKEKIFKVLAESQLGCLATVTEDGKPWVRYIMVKGDQELTIRSATFRESRKVQQIKKNPNVHISCGLSSEEGVYLQIEGQARITDSKEERHAFWSEQLTTYFENQDDPNYVVVIVEPSRIEYWDGGFEPQVWQKE